MRTPFRIDSPAGILIAPGEVIRAQVVKTVTRKPCRDQPLRHIAGQGLGAADHFLP